MNRVRLLITTFAAVLLMLGGARAENAYVTNLVSNTVSVIDTSTNKVSASVGVGSSPQGVAITPDGTRAYVTNFNSNNVSVIDTSTNTVSATVAVGVAPWGVAITPDGTRAYVTNFGSLTVSVIDTSTNTVVATVFVEAGPVGVAVTPDGTRAYVVNGTVSVIDTSSNTIVGLVLTDATSLNVAITPDGTRAFVTDFSDNAVQVIDTSSNTIVDTVAVGSGPIGVAITPAVPTVVPFSAFSAKLDISSAGFDLKATSTIGAGGTISPLTQPLTLKVGTYTVTIPPGTFKAGAHGTFTFKATINGGALKILIAPQGGNSYSTQVEASGVDLTGLTNPVTVNLTIGNNTGTTSVTAEF